MKMHNKYVLKLKISELKANLEHVCGYIKGFLI